MLGGEADRKPNAGAVRRAILVDTSRTYLTPRGGRRGDRRPRGADHRAGELRHRPARETRGTDRLRRDRPRDRPRRQRTLPGRRRRPQPARLPLLRRPRGATCWKRCWDPRCARATRSAARRRCRASRAWPRPSATSSTCCWSATCAASPATDGPAQRAAGDPQADDRGAVAEVWKLVSDPYACRAGGRGSSRVEDVDAAQRRPAQPVDQGAARPSTGAGCGPTTAASRSAENERYVWEQQLEGTPFAKHLRSSRVEIELRAAARGRPGRDRPRSQTLRGMSRLGSLDDAPAARATILDEALDGLEQALA